MTYIQPFLRLVAIGTLYGVETFSFSISLISPPGPDPDAPDEVPAGVITAFETFWPSPTMLSVDARLTTLKLNKIGTNGRYTEPETVLHEFDPPLGGNGSAHVPAQVALAVSLQTAATRGRAHAGRFYLPMPVQTPNSAGQLDDVALGFYTNPVWDLLNDLNDTVGAPWRVGVVSDVGTGAQREVTHLRFGRVLDTIRSRRDKIPEDYVVTAPLLP